MNLSPRFALPCPDDTDYAAIALYMQRLAEAAEAKLLDQRTLINDFIYQPVGIWQNSSIITAPVGGGVSAITVDNPVFVNPRAISRYSSGFSAFGALFPEPGVYHVGWDCTLMLPTGANTANTFRQFTFIIRQQTGSGVDLVLQNLTRRVNSSAAAADRFGSDGLVVVPQLNRDLINAQIEFTHGNGTSMQIAVGDLKAFYRRLGSTSQIEVA
jgi:hypothetical protein